MGAKQESRRIGSTVLAAFILVALRVAAMSTPAQAAPEQAGPEKGGAQQGSEVSRGEYLARAGDCVACHTKPGGTPLAGGLYISTPFGDISVPNITPDKQTGIGNWTDDQFYRAIHTGIGEHGEYLYPVFPYPWYTKMTRQDALAIKAYLFSVAPVHSPREPMKLGFPARIRESLLAWRTLFFTPGEFKPDPAKSPELNRGAYLVEGLGHCGECHNRENIVGVSRWSGNLEGGEVNGWYAPNITSDGKEGVGHWTVAQITTFLRSGVNPQKSVVLGPMGETIKYSLSYLSESDLRAIALYLKSFPAKETFKPKELADFHHADAPGVQTYLTYCASCHQQNGRGIKGQFPSLVGNGAVMSQGPENVEQVVLGGLPAQRGLSPMPAIGARMTDQEVASVTNYVRNTWGNTAPAVSGPGDVAKARKLNHTMLSGDPHGCAPVPPQAQNQLQADGTMASLAGISNENILQTIRKVLPDVKKAAGGKNDDTVNLMAAAYCSTLPAEKLSVPERSQRLGDVSILTYGELVTHGEE